MSQPSSEPPVQREPYLSKQEEQFRKRGTQLWSSTCTHIFTYIHVTTCTHTCTHKYIPVTMKFVSLSHVVHFWIWERVCFRGPSLPGFSARRTGKNGTNVWRVQNCRSGRQACKPNSSTQQASSNLASKLSSFQDH